MKRYNEASLDKIETLLSTGAKNRRARRAWSVLFKDLLHKQLPVEATRWPRTAQALRQYKAKEAAQRVVALSTAKEEEET